VSGSRFHQVPSPVVPRIGRGNTWSAVPSATPSSAPISSAVASTPSASAIPSSVPSATPTSSTVPSAAPLAAPTFDGTSDGRDSDGEASFDLALHSIYEARLTTKSNEEKASAVSEETERATVGGESDREKEQEESAMKPNGFGSGRR
jgi:hypothetical protein